MYMARNPNPEFTVDTGLFRQLGELLVGRDSTALVELIKNAYDADATTVVVRGESLGDPSRAVLTVADNGTGMTEAQFRRGFLRLAARGKATGERRSPLYQRRYTGEKGVGRLAAHKLAALLDVTTSAAVGRDGEALTAQLRGDSPKAKADEMLAQIAIAGRRLVLAQIDWDLIEAVDTLSDVVGGLLVASDDTDRETPTGTILTLSRLRHAWTASDVRDLVRQLHNFAPPPALVAALPRSVLKTSLLFSEPTVRDGDSLDPGLALELEGEFEEPEEYWGTVHKAAAWVLEIRAARGADVAFAITPTRVGQESNQFAKAVTATRPHPTPDSGPFFDARILLRPGQVPTLEAGWTELNSGIRVYLEGFRVLPYGEPRNDWLSLDYEYTKRTGRFQLDPLLAGQGDSLDELRALKARTVSLRLFSNRAFFGAVFLTEANTGGLRTLVNREGFVPDGVYNRLVDIVRIGLTLLHRTHAAASYALSEHEKELAEEEARRPGEAGTENQQPTDADPNDVDSTTSSSAHAEYDADEDDEPSSDDDLWMVLGSDGAPRGSAARLYLELAELRRVLGLPDRSTRTAVLSDIETAVISVEQAADSLIEDASLLRVLASVGAQLSAFTHEVAQLVPAAVAAEAALAPLKDRRWPTEALPARRAVTDIRRALERQASYLVDVASTEGRRRRTRQRLAERVDVAFLGFQGSAAARGIELINRVPPDVRTPPIFRAELQAVLTNLLSNAIKAAGSLGRVEVTGEQLEAGVRLLVQNTGVVVQPQDAEGWFAPYVSTTTDLDPVLGQGMGLGLPITRDLVSEYGGTVRFTAASPEFATAVEVVIPE